MTDAATGASVEPAPFMFKVPFTAGLLLIASGWVVFESVRLKKVGDRDPLIDCEPLPLKLIVPVPPLNVETGVVPPPLVLKFPPRFRVPEPPLNVKPTTPFA